MTESSRPHPPSPRTRRARPSIPAFVGTLAIGLALVGVPGIAAAAAEGPPLDLALYAKLLEAHTRAVPDLVGTRVDYRALRDSREWKQLVSQLASARPSRLSRDEKLAFWINAYNILAIDLVQRNHPVESIRDIGSFFSPVWDKPVVRIEKESISLGHIEHQILRKMGEPRIHAAIVCASTSCPSLSRVPFHPETLDADLTRAMKAWLSSQEKGLSIDRKKAVVTLSRIFDWFAEDFERQGGVLVAVQPYLDRSSAAWLRKNAGDASIRYFDYDWTLNDLAGGR